MQLNHALILASNLHSMSQFLIQSLGLKKGSRPPFGFDGVWLYDKNDVPCIHIAGISDITPEQSFYLGHFEQSRSRSGFSTIDHLAFYSDDYEGLKSRLSAFKVPFVERYIPQTNKHQVFITGPDDLKIEILFSISEVH